MTPTSAPSPATGSAPRVAWVDYAKGVGIALVVLGHVLRGLDPPAVIDLAAPGPAFADAWIYAFHMPLFFFVSGLFLADRVRRGATGFLLTVAATIVYPYLVWSAAQTALQAAMARHTNHPVSLDDLWRIAYQPVMQFWFLYALALVYVIYLALAKAGLGAWAILAAFVAWAAAAPWLPPVWWGPLVQAQRFAPFVALGAALYGVPALRRLPDRWSPAVAAALAITGYGTVAVLVSANALADPVAAAAAALAGIAATVALASLLGRGQAFGFVNTWGRLSLEIFLAHTIASAGVRVLLTRVVGTTEPAIHVAAGTLGGLYLPILLALVAGRLGAGFLFRLQVSRKGRESVASTEPRPRPEPVAAPELAPVVVR